MMVLITYDVNTTSITGQARLRRVAKCCENYGQRVQNSVFECLLNPEQLSEMKHLLLKIIDTSVDSLRFYNLGSKWHDRVDHIGAKEGYDPEGLLML
jgi:CRISPR-associated protein Cas2